MAMHKSTQNTGVSLSQAVQNRFSIASHSNAIFDYGKHKKTVK